MPDDAIAPFTGFPKQTLSFLAGLAAHNEKAWFDAHRDDYERYYLAPSKSFVVATGEKLARFAPKVNAEPRVNGSLSRINRDIRFSKDKSPYKTHLDLWFWEGGKRGWDCSGFYFRLMPDSLFLGAGIHVFEAQPLALFREAVLDPKKGKAAEKAIAETRKAGYEVGGLEYKKVPRGLPEDHPRAELLKYKGLYTMLDLKVPKELGSAKLVDLCAGHYQKMAPLHRWLASVVVGA
jgi:uncharacterized protein (TIGR02453 family)